jgi:hypothetical protein
VQVAIWSGRRCAPAGLTQVTLSTPSSGNGPGTHERTGVSVPTKPQVVTTQSGGPEFTATHAATGVGGEYGFLSQWVTTKSGPGPVVGTPSGHVAGSTTVWGMIVAVVHVTFR